MKPRSHRHVKQRSSMWVCPRMGDTPKLRFNHGIYIIVVVYIYIWIYISIYMYVYTCFSRQRGYSAIHDQPLNFGFPYFETTLQVLKWHGISSSCPQSQHMQFEPEKVSCAIRSYVPLFYLSVAFGCTTCAQGRDFDFVDWRSPAEILFLSPVS